MSAETLRRAAALMRERASRFDTGEPWKAIPHMARRDCMTVQSGGLFLAHYVQPQSAEHIASWHPAVALAVADLLEATGRELDSLGDPDLSAHPLDGRRTAALAVARAYLGETT